MTILPFNIEPQKKTNLLCKPITHVNIHYIIYGTSQITYENKIVQNLNTSREIIFREPIGLKWACLVERFNTLATAGVLNLPDKRVDPGCWLRSGLESPRRQLGF